jgi:hypothetical protein
MSAVVCVRSLGPAWRQTRSGYTSRAFGPDSITGDERLNVFWISATESVCHISPKISSRGTFAATFAR